MKSDPLSFLNNPTSHLPPEYPALDAVDFSFIGDTPVIDPLKLKRRMLTKLEGRPGEYVLTLDNSTSEKLNTCPRSFEYYAWRRRTSLAREELVFGGAIHNALEVYYTGKSAEAHEEIYAHFLANPPSYVDWRTPDLACKVMDKYMVKYPLSNEPFSIAVINGKPAVEIPFEVPIGYQEINQLINISESEIVEDGEENSGFYISKIHFVWSGKIDLIVIDPQGNYWVMDHKTSSILGAQFFEQFYLSQQMMGYVFACQELLGRDIKGLWLNALITRRPTKTGVGMDFVREKIAYTPEHIQEWKRDVMAIGE